MFRLVVGTETTDGNRVFCIFQENIETRKKAWELFDEIDEDMLERFISVQCNIPTSDFVEGGNFGRVEEVSRKALYESLKDIADCIEEERLELFNNKDHATFMKEYIDEVQVFNQVDDELFEIQSRLKKLYYFLLGEA